MFIRNFNFNGLSKVVMAATVTAVVPTKTKYIFN